MKSVNEIDEMGGDASSKLARLKIHRTDRPYDESATLQQLHPPPLTSSRSKPVWFGATLLVVGLTGAAVGAWVASTDGEASKRTNVAQSPAPNGPALQNVTGVSATGYVVARRQATIAAQVTGKINAILVQEGDHVEAGQAIAYLDNSLASSGLNNARANQRASHAAIEALIAERLQARKTYARLQELNKRGFARRVDVEESAAQVAVLDARLDQARAQFSASSASTGNSALIVAQHAIHAPFGGIVTSVNAQPGEIISPVSAGGGFTRTGIATIVDMSSLEIEADISENAIAQVVAGQSVTITLDAYPDRKFRGRVIQVVPAADRARATFKVRIGINMPDASILPNMAAKVRIDTARLPAELKR